MLYAQDRAIQLYHKGTRKHERVRDTDLRDLQDAFRLVSPVFEELQWLRNEVKLLGEAAATAQKQIDQMERYDGA